MSKKSTLVIPRVSKGELLITPALSRASNTHLKDLEGIFRKLGEELNEDLYMNMNITQQGVLVKWGPVSELDLESMEEVLEDSQ